MAFGPIMQLKVGTLTIELAPILKSEIGEFVAPGMQQSSVTRYLHGQTAPVLEDELEWFEKTRAESNSLTWGIYDVTSDARLLIGNTTLTDITKDHFIQSISGSMIFRKEYWGKGIASAIHKARTWYAFHHLGYDRIKSAVVHGNIASRKALEKSGYVLVFVERNTAFIEGEFRHQDNLECLNPSDASWNRWWGDDTLPRESLEARQRTSDAMAWAQEHVQLL